MRRLRDEAGITALEARLDALIPTAALEGRLAALEGRPAAAAPAPDDKVRARDDDLLRGLRAIEERLAALERRLDSVGTGADETDEDVAALARRVAALEGQRREVRAAPEIPQPREMPLPPIVGAPPAKPPDKKKERR